MTSWTSPKTWVAAASLTASELNTHLRDNLLHLKEQLTGSTAILSSDVTTSSGSFGDLTGLSFTCVSGKYYNIDAVLTYEMSTNTGGPAIGMNHPGGSCHIYIDYAGETSNTSSDRDTTSTTDTGTGVATAQAATTLYFIRLWGRYACTANGTWQLRFKRNTAGTLTIHAGSRITVHTT